MSTLPKAEIWDCTTASFIGTQLVQNCPSPEALLTLPPVTEPDAPCPCPYAPPRLGSTPTHTPQDCLAGVGGDVLEAFAQGVPRNLRNDLLVAADSITNTMSSLVKELHSVDDVAEEEDANMRNGGDRAEAE
ncbi:unnamed protein product [Pleuronectes platessa]|uniref:Uncharacterized protein n=1 Tax=Pleuronectes platessa TaxID=8262 RepID=A0A9N7VKF4_PLEPL|nr:unnamed protein product [Pleuronectes platessa]